MSEPTPAAAPALVPVQQRIITWKDGQPVLSAEPVLTKNHLQSLYFVVAAQPYVVEDPLHPDFGLYDGMTVAEVLVRKQLINAARSGDKDEIEKAMDRLLGKPKWIGESVNVHASYEDFLKGVEARVKSDAPPSFVEAHVVEPSDDNPFGDLA